MRNGTRSSADVTATPSRRLSVRLASQTAARRELQQALLAWEEAARAQAGVCAAHVYEDVVAAGVFGLEVEASTPAALEAHLRSQDFGALLGALNVLAQDVHMTVCQPATEFGNDAASGIRRVRGKLAPADGD